MEKPSAKILEAHAEAVRARENAHAPYSNFRVGAALVTRGGSIVSGCNVENASYGGTVCAERIAIFKAVSAGIRDFTDLVVVTEGEEPAFPCALCLQVMAEFFEPDGRIWIADKSKAYKSHLFSELLPFPFGPQSLP